MNVVITSPEAGSGKTTIAVALGQRLRRLGLRLAYARAATPEAQDDCQFVSRALRVASGAASVVSADADLPKVGEAADVRLVEGDDPLNVNGSHTLVVARYRADDLADGIITHARSATSSDVAVVVNAVPEKGIRYVQQRVIPAITAAGLGVLAVLPQDRALLGMSVGDLAAFLGAEVLCARDQLDRPVEAVMIAAMSDEGAELYFSRIPRKAVVAGGDRPDIHMPALATDTSCLVLTEGRDPDPTIFKTADEQGVPLLKVSPGTIETLDQISDALRKARFRQLHKVARAVSLFDAHVNETLLGAFVKDVNAEAAS